MFIFLTSVYFPRLFLNIPTLLTPLKSEQLLDRAAEILPHTAPAKDPTIAMAELDKAVWC